MVGDHETALDITQEAFARLYRHWKKVSRYEQPDAWVRRIAINLSISHLRRRRVQRNALELLLPVARDDSFVDADVLSAVRRLPPAQRAATVLFYFEDMPSSEIATILECSQSTARVHLHKARARLAKMLGTTEEERSFDVAR
jgi:RNA polymerase sigma-70 factor (ECF subfamily)